MSNDRLNDCFVVMPFGQKPLPSDPDRFHDFDKVYRVLIQRAIREAGMVPVRADERLGSALIHSDMFRDLRDRAVVLADLSLDNPNVFYELGMRHVMSARGTVLMCQQGSELPFDVKLSRTIFYNYDGQNLDWEEVERVVVQLVASLQQAKAGLPDSPVHALLPSVLRRDIPEEKVRRQRPEDAPDAEPQEEFQRLVAELWASQKKEPQLLAEAHQGSVFGSRAVAYLCLDTDPTTVTAKRLANHLNDGQQFRLANRLYEKVREAGKLTRGSLLAYASSYSEANLNVKGADHAISLVEDALESTRRQYAGAEESPDALLAFAECHRRLAGLRQWRWQLSKDSRDLDRALKALSSATDFNSTARQLGVMRHPGFLAQIQLKEMLLLRVRDGNINRPDVEGHQEAILAVKPEPDDDPVGVSYLSWFQAITLADMGIDEQSNERALKALSYDAKLKDNPKYWEIGGRQYTQLRRFIDQNSSQLRNQSLIGRISQILQTTGQA